MSQTTQLIDLNINLFLYDLRDSLGSNTTQVDQNRRKYWQRIYNDNLTDEQLAELQTAEGSFSNYIELLGKEQVKKFDGLLDGFYYPVQLGDTYALMIECAGRIDAEWNQMPLHQQLLDIKNIILEHLNQIPAQLGKTWLIWGKLSHPNQDLEKTAQICYEKSEIILDANWQRDFKGSLGRLLNATLFEIEKPDLTPDNINNNHHVIICLFDYEQTEEQMGQSITQLCREDFIRLFRYRNKILWVYEQSRQVKDSLKKASGKIKNIVHSLPKRMDQSDLDLKPLQKDLANALSISYAYELALGVLQEQQTTIEININSYLDRVENIRERDSNSNIDFLNKFSDSANDKLNQIKTDYQSLNSGLKPLENFIKTVEGIIEIERTKNERTLNKTVAIASVGISTASLAASTFSGEQAQGIIQSILPVPAQQRTPAKTILLSFGLAFFMSLFIGVISAKITWCILNKKQR